MTTVVTKIRKKFKEVRDLEVFYWNGFRYTKIVLRDKTLARPFPHQGQLSELPLGGDAIVEFRLEHTVKDSWMQDGF